MRMVFERTEMRTANESALVESTDYPQEFKIVSLRGYPTPAGPELTMDYPEKAAAYWRSHIEGPGFNRDVEHVHALLLDGRDRIKGHHCISVGSVNGACVVSREVFRLAVLLAASSVIVMHNHPSGDPTPGEADVTLTRILCLAGQTIGIPVKDHVIVGARYFSLRSMGIFDEFEKRDPAFLASLTERWRADAKALRTPKFATSDRAVEARTLRNCADQLERYIHRLAQAMPPHQLEMLLK